MVSMKEIAKQCNVSVATVSKALNGYSDIGEETKNQVVSGVFCAFSRHSTYCTIWIFVFLTI